MQISKKKMLKKDIPQNLAERVAVLEKRAEALEKKVKSVDKSN